MALTICCGMVADCRLQSCSGETLDRETGTLDSLASEVEALDCETELAETLEDDDEIPDTPLLELLSGGVGGMIGEMDAAELKLLRLLLGLTLELLLELDEDCGLSGEELLELELGLELEVTEGVVDGLELDELELELDGSGAGTPLGELELLLLEELGRLLGELELLLDDEGKTAGTEDGLLELELLD